MRKKISLAFHGLSGQSVFCFDRPLAQPLMTKKAAIPEMIFCISLIMLRLTESFAG
jgi:hypothetical protein